MNRYDMVREEERLTLVLPIERRLMNAGCPLFLLAAVSTLALGFLSIAFEAHSLNDRRAGDPSRLFNPHQNQFGFLWLVACILVAVFVPLYVYLVRRYSTVFTFDLEKGALLKHGKPVTWLARIEFVRIRRFRDPDNVSTYSLYVVHNDGHELLVDELGEEAEILQLAREIAEFIGVRVLGFGARMKSA